MSLDPGTFLPALLTLVGGGFLSILLARVLTVVLGRITRRTRSRTDDFIVQLLGETIPPAGWVVSAAIAWQIIPTNARPASNERILLRLCSTFSSFGKWTNQVNNFDSSF